MKRTERKSGKEEWKEESWNVRIREEGGRSCQASALLSQKGIAALRRATMISWAGQRTAEEEETSLYDYRQREMLSQVWYMKYIKWKKYVREGYGKYQHEKKRKIQEISEKWRKKLYNMKSNHHQASEKKKTMKAINNWKATSGRINSGQQKYLYLNYESENYMWRTQWQNININISPSEAEERRKETIYISIYNERLYITIGKSSIYKSENI